MDISIVNSHAIYKVLYPKEMDDDELMMMNCFCGMAERQKTFSLISSRTIERDPHHRESLTHHKQDLKLAEPEVRLSWMKWCSSDNYYTTVPKLFWLNHWLVRIIVAVKIHQSVMCLAEKYFQLVSYYTSKFFKQLEGGIILEGLKTKYTFNVIHVEFFVLDFRQ